MKLPNLLWDCPSNLDLIFPERTQTSGAQFFEAFVIDLFAIDVILYASSHFQFYTL